MTPSGRTLSLFGGLVATVQDDRAPLKVRVKARDDALLLLERVYLPRSEWEWVQRNCTIARCIPNTARFG